jgi:hypothetical protein
MHAGNAQTTDSPLLTAALTCSLISSLLLNGRSSLQLRPGALVFNRLRAVIFGVMQYSPARLLCAVASDRPSRGWRTPRASRSIAAWGQDGPLRSRPRRHGLDDRNREENQATAGIVRCGSSRVQSVACLAERVARAYSTPLFTSL